MKLWRFEGTTEEFNAVSEALIGKSANYEVAVSSDVIETPSVVSGFATVEQAVEILSRRDLSDNMTRVLQALGKAVTQRLTSDDLKKINGHDANQFRGLMGAFGRRTKYTLPDGVRFFDDQWDGARGQYTWSLPETVREALRLQGLI